MSESTAILGFIRGILPAVLIFSLGFICGYVARLFVDRARGEDDGDVARSVIALSILVIWILANGVAIIDPSYDVPLALHLIFGAPVGYFLRPVQFGNIKNPLKE